MSSVVNMSVLLTPMAHLLLRRNQEPRFRTPIKSSHNFVSFLF